MDKQKMITALNKAIALEHSATLQYQQHALLVNGFGAKSSLTFLPLEQKALLNMLASSVVRS